MGEYRQRDENFSIQQQQHEVVKSSVAREPVCEQKVEINQLILNALIVIDELILQFTFVRAVVQHTTLWLNNCTLR